MLAGSPDSVNVVCASTSSSFSCVAGGALAGGALMSDDAAFFMAFEPTQPITNTSWCGRRHDVDGVDDECAASCRRFKSVSEGRTLRRYIGYGLRAIELRAIELST